jgi:hypothetical protein
MSETVVLLKAYFEALHSILEEKKDILAENIKGELSKEIKNRGFKDVNKEKFAAYWEACLAFIEERIEAYNPFGIQYLYDGSRRKEAFKLELQLDWYDSKAEYKALFKAALDKIEMSDSEKDFKILAKELIGEFVAFPNRSIISTYRARPTLNRLPDYVVARLIEGIL